MLGYIKKIFCGLLLICNIFLCACVPSSKILKQKEQGLYPDASDFPNTKWVCSEINMSLYVFEYEENYIIGDYIFDGESYRVVASFFFDKFDFTVYSSTEISHSEHSSSMVHCEQISYGFINTEYFYDKDSGTIVCSVRNYDLANEELIPMTLTFEKVGSIAQKTNTRWYAKELDMYLDSFNDTMDYFKGQLTVEGEICYVNALEIGNNNYFMLTIENGKVNNLMPGTTSVLICMHFEKEDDQIIAKVSDEYLFNKVSFPYWRYNDAIITFEAFSS